MPFFKKKKSEDIPYLFLLPTIFSSSLPILLRANLIWKCCSFLNVLSSIDELYSYLYWVPMLFSLLKPVVWSFQLWQITSLNQPHVLKLHFFFWPYFICICSSSMCFCVIPLGSYIWTKKKKMAKIYHYHVLSIDYPPFFLCMKNKDTKDSKIQLPNENKYLIRNWSLHMVE